MGSLPSATNTICSARIAVLPTGSDFFGMAQYIPVSAKATSRISAVRFMGEASGADLAPGEVYALEDLWITTNFRIASRHERWRHLRTEEQWQTLPYFWLDSAPGGKTICRCLLSDISPDAVARPLHGVIPVAAVPPGGTDTAEALRLESDSLEVARAPWPEQPRPGRDLRPWTAPQFLLVTPG